MGEFKLRFDGNKIFIEGLPEDVVDIIDISNVLPAQKLHLTSLAGHRIDLSFTKTCLNLINEVAEKQAQVALWRMAVIYYCKCFSQPAKGAGRKPLNPSKILKNDEVGQGIHSEFIALRNRHLIHDENNWLQITVGATLYGPDKDKKVEGLSCTTFEGESLGRENFANLFLLVERALSWLNPEYEKLCSHIVRELEKLPRETLINQPRITYQAPLPGEIYHAR
jgi:hypothetical protein